MKVLFIKRYLDRAELELTLDLKAKGVDIYVMAYSKSSGIERLKAQGIYIEPVPYTTKIHLGLIRQIRRVVKDYGIELIHSTESKSLSNAIFATYFLNVKIVGYRGTLGKIRKADLSYWLGLLNPRVDKIFCINQSVHDYLLKFFPPQKLVVNQKGYDPSWSINHSNSIPDIPLPKDSVVVMYIADARGRPYKGLEILLDAMKQVANHQVHCVFIGSYDEAALQKAKAGPAGERIHFLGTQSGAASYLKQADIFVLPSTRDGLPRVIKEAMAEGLPVICSDIPGPTDLVLDQKTGLLFESGSAEKLAQAITTLASQPELRQQLGQAGKHFLLSDFSPETHLRKTLDAYRSLLQEPANP